VAHELDQIHGYLEAVSPIFYRKAESNRICSLRCLHGLLASPIKLGIPQVALLLLMNGKVYIRKHQKICSYLVHSIVDRRQCSTNQQLVVLWSTRVHDMDTV
jgi:hypothetical protein